MGLTVGKGDRRRPRRTGKSENELRKALAYGDITREEYDRQFQEMLDRNEITRDGRTIGGQNKWEINTHDEQETDKS